MHNPSRSHSPFLSPPLSLFSHSYHLSPPLPPRLSLYHQGSIDDTSIKQQISIIENGVNYSTRRYNDLRATNDRLTKELKAKLDKLNEEKKNFEELDALLKVDIAVINKDELLSFIKNCIIH